MMLAGQLGLPASGQEPSLEELSKIQALLEANDVQALNAYLRLNPNLLEGDTPLAGLLNDYLQDTRNVTNFLRSDPNRADGGSRESDPFSDPSGFAPAAGIAGDQY